MKLEKLYRDLFYICASFLIAVLLVQVGIISDFLRTNNHQWALTSFFAGLFFPSIFTIAPAAAALGELARQHSLILVAFWGGIGAMIGDLVLFLFVRDVFAKDLRSYLRKHKIRFGKYFRQQKLFRWLNPLLGALIILSPLPDEFGIALLGTSKTRLSFFLPLTGFLNFFSILLIGYIARQI